MTDDSIPLIAPRTSAGLSNAIATCVNEGYRGRDKPLLSTRYRTASLMISGPLSNPVFLAELVHRLSDEDKIAFWEAFNERE